MDVGCSHWGFVASTMTPYRLGHTPFSLKLTPTCTCNTSAHVIRHKDAPICPSTSSQAAKTLCIHPIWMWDAVNGGLQPQPWHHNIIQAWRAQPCHLSPKIHPHLNRYYGYNDAPICPSTASQGAKTLCIHPIWMWDAVNEGFQPQPWHCNIIQGGKTCIIWSKRQKIYK